jgi:ABC-2 type transport system ATP-binding protein
MSVATITNLTVKYGSKLAVGDFSVEVPEGCTGLLGPNGAGKTTLIKTLLGFLHPSSGRGEVLGYDISTQGLRIRQRVGLMPEQDCHIPGMNAVTFAAYCGELCGMPAHHAMRRAHETLEYCGLGEARYRNIETYSTGMKQRIKLAQALVHGPALLFLDEPTNGLDPAGRDEMLALVRDISHGKGMHVVLSSHLLPDIERICDNVIVMREGKVAQQGAIAELRSLGGTQVIVELRVPSPEFVDAMAHSGSKVLGQAGSQYRFTIPNGSSDIGQVVFQCARNAGAQVRSFQPAMRSLEDVFMEAVQ